MLFKWHHICLCNSSTTKISLLLDPTDVLWGGLLDVHNAVHVIIDDGVSFNLFSIHKYLNVIAQMLLFKSRTRKEGLYQRCYVVRILSRTQKLRLGSSVDKNMTVFQKRRQTVVPTIETPFECPFVGHSSSAFRCKLRRIFIQISKIILWAHLNFMFVKRLSTFLGWFN